MRWLAVVLLIAGCGESTATICTRPDEGSACSMENSAERIEGEVEAWEVTLRTTVVDTVEYTDGGVQCALTRTTCVVEECIYARSQDPRFPPNQGWFLIPDGEAPILLGPGIDSAEWAIEECRGYYGR